MTRERQEKDDSMDTAIEHVNTKLVPGEGVDSLAQQASILLSNLEVDLTEKTRQLQEIVNGLNRARGRLEYQVSLFQSDCQHLTEIVQDNKVKVEEIITSKPESLAKLEQLQLVKTNLQSVIDTFEEAKTKLVGVENEKATSQEISTLIDAGNYSQADVKIKRVERLIPIWKGTSEFKTKSDYASSLRSLLDNALKDQHHQLRPQSPNASSSPITDSLDTAQEPQSRASSDSSSMPATSFGGRLFGQFKRMGY